MMLRHALLLVLGMGAAAAAEIPVVDFFRLPQYDDMQLSPDGRHIAALAPAGGRQNLVLLDMSGRTAKPVTAGDGVDVVWFKWLTDKRLLVQSAVLNERMSDIREGGDYVAIDLDGKSPHRIGERPRDPMSRRDITGAARNVSSMRTLRLVRTLPDSDDVIVQEAIIDRDLKWAGAGLFRLNTRTGVQTNLGVGKPDSGEWERWIVDNSGAPRGFTAYRRGAQASYYRAPDSAEWIKIDESPLTDRGIELLAVDESEPGLYVTSNRGRDMGAIHTWSPGHRTLDKPVAAHPQVDLDRLVMDEGKVVGVSYQADTAGVAWLDASIARVQKAVDSALPDRVNRLSWSRDRTRFLIDSSSGTLPGSFYLFDVKAGKLEWLADRMPWIKPADMAPMRAVRYKARDGLEIPGYVTVPRGPAGVKRPLVVLVHGGPWVNGADGSFDGEAQFFASRGYVVLAPNFRGSLGYGFKHYSASFGQWGLAMQDDLADGVQWAVEQGLADPKRVCLYGASYGGYAAMMGLAKHPDLYRCAVNYVGVTDLPAMLTVSWSDYAYSDYIRYSSKELVGDPDKDRERLEATSPARLASKMRGAVLMAYGGADQRVPIVHGTKMKSALDAAGRKYEWIVMEGEGHGFFRLDNRVEFYTAVERFLGTHLRAENPAP